MENEKQINPIHHHYLITIIAVLVTAFVTTILSIAIAYYIMSKQSDEKYRRAMEETATTVFLKLGNSAQSQGTVVDYDKIAKKTKEIMAPELVSLINKQNGVINQLSVTVAKVDGKIENLKPTIIERQVDGSFKTVLEQNRGALPPLTNVSLSYNAKDLNLKTALQGQWIPNQEKISIRTLKWTGPANGFKFAVEADRDVYTPDGNTKIGQTEHLNIISSDVSFLKDDLIHIAPFPKWTFTLDGLIRTTDGKKGYDFNTTKWMTRNWGINSGYLQIGSEKMIKIGTSINVGKQ